MTSGLLSLVALAFDALHLNYVMVASCFMDVMHIFLQHSVLAAACALIRVADQLGDLP